MKLETNVIQKLKSNFILSFLLTDVIKENGDLRKVLGKKLKIQTQRFLKQRMVDYLCNQNMLNVELKNQDL